MSHIKPLAAVCLVVSCPLDNEEHLKSSIIMRVMERKERHSLESQLGGCLAGYQPWMDKASPPSSSLPNSQRNHTVGGCDPASPIASALACPFLPSLRPQSPSAPPLYFILTQRHRILLTKAESCSSAEGPSAPSSPSLRPLTSSFASGGSVPPNGLSLS